MNIVYAPSFLRDLKKRPQNLKQEATEAILLFTSNPKHPSLKAHPLKGRLQGLSSFSINYSHRIIFKKKRNSEYILLAIGDHDVYKH